MKWTFSKIWNESLENRKERELAIRDYIWASELGGSFIDRYLKMKAISPSNPPNPRSLRKFEAGNMMEWVVGLVLKRAGILHSNQDWIDYQYPYLLKVTGRLDFIAGGETDWEKAKVEVHALELPEFFNRATTSILNHFEKTYPKGLDQIVIEVKSCSSFMFEMYERNGVNKNHALQLFHYLKAKNLAEGHIVYISKDDLRMLEFGVNNPSETEELYKTDIANMTAFIKNNMQPDKEQEIFFDTDTAKFRMNWKVTYSNYLTKIYGYKDQLEYETKYRPLVSSWNRVLGRVVRGDNMTKLNLEVIDNIKGVFANFDELVQIGKDKGITPEDVVTEETL